MISIFLQYLEDPFEQILCNFNKIQFNKFNSQWHKHCSLICYFHFCYGCITILVIKRNLFSMRKIAERVTKNTVMCLCKSFRYLVSMFLSHLNTIPAWLQRGQMTPCLWFAIILLSPGVKIFVKSYLLLYVSKKLLGLFSQLQVTDKKISKLILLGANIDCCVEGGGFNSSPPSATYMH